MTAIDEEQVSFEGEGNLKLHGWFSKPCTTSTQVPALVLQGTVAGTAEHLRPVARRFAKAGFGVLCYDHRNFGNSEGTPRQEADPWLQTKDLRRAMTYLESRPDVDGERLGLWGLSYGGANALFVTSLDIRVRAVAGIAPPVSGYAAARAHRSRTQMRRVAEATAEERRDRWLGHHPKMIPLFGTGSPNELSLFDPLSTEVAGGRGTELTLLSLDLLLQLELLPYAPRIEVPAFLVKAAHDTVCLPSLIDDFAAHLPGTKELLSLDCTHFDVLTRQLPRIVGASAKFFTEALSPTVHGVSPD
ncbi:alpha/beta hydrolase [Amycolatopsis sp. WQ 127309]|uniref:alpha/beta hydrolase n=1 Tax=Amycolatopsis sp. WQ 127309 TaxID=2932773 RepID=UPI001FF5A12D|nr:alpha/beta fold hydrolase [Amycolatopsis sp. WQ 127309]UOZ07009.1 alpha/beta fold hydrolase [Amycolatopsis sp. WQ 127309]